MSERTPSLEFTGILYGIVASNALFRLSYALSLRNAMLLFAFFVLATDWAEYRVSATEVPETAWHRLLQFALEVVLLVVWTVLTIVPERDVPVFVAVVGVFVLLQGLWDRLLYDEAFRGTLLGANTETALACLGLAALTLVVPLGRATLLVLTILLFLALKQRVWRRMYADLADSDAAPRL